MKKIEKLTLEQESKIFEVRDFWANYLTSCKNTLDENKARKSIEWLYSYCGKEKPLIIFMDSPFGCQVAANYFFKILKSNKGNIASDISSNVWNNISSNVFNNINSNIGDTTKSHISNNIYLSVKSFVGNSVNIKNRIYSDNNRKICKDISYKIGSKIWVNIQNNVNTKLSDNLWEDIYEKMYDNTWGNIVNIKKKIRINIEDNKFKYYSFSYKGNVGDYGWVAYIDYFFKTKLIHSNVEKDFNSFKELLLSGVYEMIQFDGLCIVSGLPTKIVKNSEGRLHNLNGPTVEFKDGWCQYNINGRYLPSWIWDKVKAGEITKEMFLKEKNSEIKSVIYELLGQKKMMDLLGAEVIDERIISHRNGDLETVTLLKTIEKFEEIDNQPFAWVKMVCPSTGSQYLQGVEPHHMDAIEAIASLSPFSAKDYSFDLRS